MHIRTECSYKKQTHTVTLSLLQNTLKIQISTETPSELSSQTPHPCIGFHELRQISENKQLSQHFEDLEQLYQYMKEQKNVKIIQNHKSKIEVCVLQSVGKSDGGKYIQLGRVQVQVGGQDGVAKFGVGKECEMLRLQRVCIKDSAQIYGCVKDSVLYIQICHKTTETTKDIYTSFIKQLKSIENLQEHFETPENLLCYMRDPQNIRIDFVNKKIEILAKIQTKKSKIVQIGSFDFIYNKTISQTRQEKQLQQIRSMLQNCSNKKQLSQEKIGNIFQQIVEVLIGLVSEKKIYKEYSGNIFQRLNSLELAHDMEEKYKKQIANDSYFQRFQDFQENILKQKDKFYEITKSQNQKITKLESQIQEINKCLGMPQRSESVSREQSKQYKHFKQQSEKLEPNENQELKFQKRVSKKQKQAPQPLFRSTDLMQFFNSLGNEPLLKQKSSKSQSLLYYTSGLASEPPSISYQQALEEQFLQKIKVQHFSDLENQLRVSLNMKQIQQLPNKICTLSGMKNLHLHSNQLKFLPADIGRLKNLQSLVLYNNYLQQIPLSFGELTSLTDLDLSQNKLQVLPSEFCNLKNLQKLYLQKNRLIFLPESFGCLCTLKSLLLYENKFQTLPQSFKKLQQLSYLSLSLFQTIPSFISCLGNLAQLYIYYRKYSEKHIKNIKLVCHTKNIKLKYKIKVPNSMSLSTEINSIGFQKIEQK